MDHLFRIFHPYLHLKTFWMIQISFRDGGGTINADEVGAGLENWKHNPWMSSFIFER